MAIPTCNPVACTLSVLYVIIILFVFYSPPLQPPLFDMMCAPNYVYIYIYYRMYLCTMTTMQLCLILCKSTTYLHFRIVDTVHHRIIYENAALALQTGNLCVDGNNKYHDLIMSSAHDWCPLIIIIWTFLSKT